MKRLTAAALLACGAACAAAQDIPSHPALNDRFYGGAGIFFPKTSTSAQLTSRAGAGAFIEFEDSLGVDRSKSVPAVFARWRLGERWRVEFEYFQLDRGGQRVIDRDIPWGENTYPVNANVATKFDFFDLRVSAGYSFFRTRDKEIGAGFGLHVAGYDVGLTANAIGSEEQDITAPLPVISLYGQFALTDRWAVSARLDRFSLSYDNYDGSLGALGLDLMYQPFRNVGFGAGYRALFISLEAEKSARSLKVEQSFHGPLLFMTVSF